jgi:hypothetical protein
LPEDLFADGRGTGGYTPADLCTGSKYTGPFNGITEDYTLMERSGFDILDKIVTQEKFVEYWEKIQVIDTGHRVNSLCLVEPFLLCGRMRDAEYEISMSFIHSMSAYEAYQKHLETGVIEPEPSYEEKLLQGANQKLKLWHLCQGRQFRELQSYIDDNYQRNMGWIQDYGIPTVLFTRERLLNTDLR